MCFDLEIGKSFSFDKNPQGIFYETQFLDFYAMSENRFIGFEDREGCWDHLIRSLM